MIIDLKIAISVPAELFIVFIDARSPFCISCPNITKMRSIYR